MTIDYNCMIWEDIISSIDLYLSSKLGVGFV
jgi:hypothetical protein